MNTSVSTDVLAVFVDAGNVAAPASGLRSPTRRRPARGAVTHRAPRHRNGTRQNAEPPLTFVHRARGASLLSLTEFSACSLPGKLYGKGT